MTAVGVEGELQKLCSTCELDSQGHLHPVQILNSISFTKPSG